MCPLGVGNAGDGGRQAWPRLEEAIAMKIGVTRETAPGDQRVATVPDVVEKLIKRGLAVAVESGAGAGANLSDDAYLRAASASCAVSFR